MTVLGIMGSPRRHGNSEALLEKVLEGASYRGARVEKIILNKLDIKPCQECSRCRKGDICYIRDDMRPLYRKLQKADAIVVASPVFFGSVTAQVKAMVDRCQYLWFKNIKNRKKPIARKRRGIFISVSGHNRRRFFRNSKEIIDIFFMVSGVELFRELYVPNLEHPGDALAKKWAVNKAFKYGAELVS